MKYTIEYLPSAPEDLKLSVKNYFLFCRIDETKKTVSAARATLQNPFSNATQVLRARLKRAACD